jgi:hypothetical protein
VATSAAAGLPARRVPRPVQRAADPHLIKSRAMEHGSPVVFAGSVADKAARIRVAYSSKPTS